jgi:hypothetical protein
MAGVRMDFSTDQLAPLQPWTVGGGQVVRTADRLVLSLADVSQGTYADAQISDDRTLTGAGSGWRPPLRLSILAQASGPAESLGGTAGFGFWNDPFLPGRRTLLRLPRALWFFFGGPGNDMPLAQGVPGHGWKAATFDPLRARFFGLLPFALPGFLLMRVPALYRVLWPVGQRALGVAEAALPGQWLAEPHEYTLLWLPDFVRFSVDDQTVLETDRSPRGPLTFIAWIDNQIAVVTPQGRFHRGTVACEAQWLALNWLEIVPL